MSWNQSIGTNVNRSGAVQEQRRAWQPDLVQKMRDQLLPRVYHTMKTERCMAGAKLFLMAV